MAHFLQPYREAINQRLHAVCIDRNLDPHSTVNTEADCRIDRYLPQLVALARLSRRDDLQEFTAGVRRTICSRCGNQDAMGACHLRDDTECCLYRYLPLVYDAVLDVSNRRA